MSHRHNPAFEKGEEAALSLKALQQKACSTKEIPTQLSWAWVPGEFAWAMPSADHTPLQHSVLPNYSLWNWKKNTPDDWLTPSVESRGQHCTLEDSLIFLGGERGGPCIVSVQAPGQSKKEVACSSAISGNLHRSAQMDYRWPQRGRTGCRGFHQRSAAMISSRKWN